MPDQPRSTLNFCRGEDERIFSLVTPPLFGKINHKRLAQKIKTKNRNFTEGKQSARLYVALQRRFAASGLSFQSQS
jgi:hypothetical protein